MPVNAADSPAPEVPKARLCLGVTGHREDNAAYFANAERIEAVLRELFDRIGCAVHTSVKPRLHCLLVDGADQVAATEALARGWELVAPLPFGLDLNVAIHAQPADAAQASALLSGGVRDDELPADVRSRAVRIRELAARAHLFALADRDEAIAALLLQKLESPTDALKASTFTAEASLRAALAGRVMIEQSDVLIGVWDGVTRALVGGTGHTIQAALEVGTPVVWIDATEPERWRVLAGPESLATLQTSACDPEAEWAALRRSIEQALLPARPVAPTAHHRDHRPRPGVETLSLESLPERSRRVWHLYRRIEALFGESSLRRRFRSLLQTYEAPAAIEAGSGAVLLAQARGLVGESFARSIASKVLHRFAWADGISSRLSDTYRGGMSLNFVMAALAIVVGIAYLPFATSDSKWVFALIELLLLVAVLSITLTGQRRRWHGRWFETRRAAEYLRHGPILLLFGAARSVGRWPVGTETSWPEWYARHSLREVGLPRMAVTQANLREAVSGLLRTHVADQRDYHEAKAKRLAAIHHNLDRCSEVLFQLAIVSVAMYLLLRVGGALHWWSHDLAHGLSYGFTFLGVMLPTFGGAIAGIRYFGDFERFAAISRVTAGKLRAIGARIDQLIGAPEGAIDFGRAADLAHATDDVVVAEIESWQAVFGGKQVTVPV